MQQKVVAVPPSMSTAPLGPEVAAPHEPSEPLRDGKYWKEVWLRLPLQAVPASIITVGDPEQLLFPYPATYPSVGHVSAPHVHPQPLLSSRAPTTIVFVNIVVPLGGQVWMPD
jgi:hypothetical protein